MLILHMLLSIPFHPNINLSISISLHRDGRVLDTVCQLQHSGSRHLMRTSAEFMSSVAAPTIFTSFGFRDMVRGRLMCIVLCPNIVQITMCFFVTIPCMSHLAIDTSLCMKLKMNHCVKYITINRMSRSITIF